MNIKKSLFKLIILTMLFTGCSNYQVQDKGISLPNEATKQKTMTEVQNNVNEIINKDYNYVLSNLGKPNVTSYWINKGKVDDLKTLGDIKKITDISLIYMKNVSEEKANSSALYLQLNNDIVKNAQIVDYSRANISKITNKYRILVNCYNNYGVVKLSDLNIKNLDDYVGIDVSKMDTIIGNKQPSYDAYLYDNKEKSLSVYKLGDKDKLLAIFTKDNKISEVKIIDNNKEVVNEIKNIMLNN